MRAGMAGRHGGPAWRAGAPCDADGARLTERPRDGDVHLRATDADTDTGDVDGDGDPDAAAVLRCTIGTGGPMPAAAFGRDNDGAIVSLAGSCGPPSADHSG